MALSKSIKEMRVVMVGKTGVGKSGVGNSLLNKKNFTSNTWAGSVTSKCKFGTRSLENGTKLVIVDTPGIFDTSKSNMETSKEIIRCIGLSSPGPHAFFFVLKIGARFTAEERDTIQSLKDIFGQDVMKYVIVVFTGKDNLEAEDITMEEYLGQAPVDLLSLIAECNGRYAVINNRAPMAVRVKDIEGILQMVRRTMDDNHGKHYTGEMYAAAEEAFNEKVQLLEEEKHKRERELEIRGNELEEENRKRRQMLEAEMDEHRKKAEEQEQKRQMEAKQREIELTKERERLANLKHEAEEDEKRRAEEFKQLADDQKEARRQMQEDMRNREREMDEAREKEEEERAAEREKQEKERQEELMIQRQRDEERIHKLEEEHRLKMVKLAEEAEEEKKRLETEREKLGNEDNRQRFRQQVQDDDNFLVKGLKAVAAPFVSLWKGVTSWFS